MAGLWQRQWRSKMTFISSSLAVVRARCPELYEETKEVNERHFAEVLPGIIQKMKWERNEIILDHGCGVGSTCSQYFLPMAEQMESKIIGLDNSESMIIHASQSYAHDCISYVHGELTGVEQGSIGFKFNKIFSLYTLHMIEDYKKELRAMKNVLAEGGEAFLIFPFQLHFFDLFAKLMEDERWKEYAKVHLVVPEWTRGENWEENLKMTFEELGFVILDWKLDERIHKFETREKFADFLFSVNSFAKSLPTKEQEELQDIYRKHNRETVTKTYNPSKHVGNEYVLHYLTVNVHVKNPK